MLNWFDITEIEGRFSLNDKIGDIMKTFRGKLWFVGMLISLMQKSKQAGKAKAKSASSKGKKKGTMPKLNGGLMKMVGAFSVLRLTSMMGMVNIAFTKEELLKMNRKLNRIRKPKERA